MEKEILIRQIKRDRKALCSGPELPLNNLTEETDFINDLKVNSANLIDIVLDVEDVFDIEIDNESMEQMLNVKKAIEIIQG